MISVVLLLLGLGTVETTTRYTLCDTPHLNIFYTLCDESIHPVVSLDPCIFNRKGHMNFSVTVIPKMDFERSYAMVEIWHKSMKVSDNRYDLCFGVDEEFDFCGGVKGETQSMYYYEGRLSNLPFMKGIFIVKVQLIEGQKEELMFCGAVTINIKV